MEGIPDKPDVWSICMAPIAAAGRSLAQSGVSDMSSSLDLHGLINVPVASRGRYGQTRETAASRPIRCIWS